MLETAYRSEVRRLATPAIAERLGRPAHKVHDTLVRMQFKIQFTQRGVKWRVRCERVGKADVWWLEEREVLSS